MSSIVVVVFEDGRVGPAASGLYYRSRGAEGPPVVETNPHFLARFKPTSFIATIGLRQNPARDVPSGVQPETNPHFLARFQPTVLATRFSYNYRGADLSTTLPTQPETQPHFLARFTPTRPTVLASLRQTIAADQFLFVSETNPHSIARFQPASPRLLRSLWQNPATDLQPSTPLAETNQQFIGRFSPTTILVNRRIFWNTPYDTSAPAPPPPPPPPPNPNPDVWIPVPPYRDGAPGIMSYPHAMGAVLQSVAMASGVPTPDSLSANVVALIQNQTVLLIPPNPDRSFLLIYNPTYMPAQFSFGTAVQGGLNNLSIGPGQAYFWATAQGLTPCYTGQLTAVGLLPLFLWVWEDGSNFYNNGGALAANTLPSGYPTSDEGLPVGAIWSNGLEISVVPGFVPNPVAPALFFGSITAAQLLASGGGNLPLFDPLVKNQLWNDGGVVAISDGNGGTGTQPFILDHSLLDGPDVLS